MRNRRQCGGDMKVQEDLEEPLSNNWQNDNQYLQVKSIKKTFGLCIILFLVIAENA